MIYLMHSTTLRVSLASVKKKHWKQIADHINDFLNDQSSQFSMTNGI